MQRGRLFRSLEKQFHSVTRKTTTTTKTQPPVFAVVSVNIVTLYADYQDGLRWALQGLGQKVIGCRFVVVYRCLFLWQSREVIVSISQKSIGNVFPEQQRQISVQVKSSQSFFKYSLEQKSFLSVWNLKRVQRTPLVGEYRHGCQVKVCSTRIVIFSSSLLLLLFPFLGSLPLCIPESSVIVKSCVILLGSSHAPLLIVARPSVSLKIVRQ